MNIKEQYQQLVNHDVNLSSIDQINALRDQCLIEQNNEYYFLCNLLLADVYIEFDMQDDALAVLNKDMYRIDNVTFQSIYVSYLERIIYINIKKRNFKTAYRYVFEKRKYIDNKNRDQVNRWYLEMAYIYAEMKQTTKALANLRAILENLPNMQLLSHTLSNLTKLYIDQHMLKEAKETLNQCLSITHDQEGQTYCNYLLAQIYVQEDKFKEALILFSEIFQNEIRRDYLGMANDYLNLLIMIKQHKEADAFIMRIEPMIIQSEELEIKKIFYQNKLKALLSKIGIENANSLFDAITHLDDALLARDEWKTSENIDDEQASITYLHTKSLIDRIDKLIHSVNIAFVTNDLRSMLMEYGKKLEMLVEFDEVTFLLFENLNGIENPNAIKTYTYRKQRLYEKYIPYDNLANSIVEMMLTHGKDIELDFSHTNLIMYDFIQKKTYRDLDINYILGVPAFKNNTMFFAAVYASKTNDILTIDSGVILKLASKLLEHKIANAILSSSNTMNTYILENLFNQMHLYKIVYEVDSILLDDRLMQLFATKQKRISLDLYQKWIHKTDMRKYQEYIRNEIEEVTYGLLIQGRNLHAHETRYTYHQNDIHSVVGIIQIQEESNQKFLDDERFYAKMNEYKSFVNNLEFKFSLIRIKASISQFDLIRRVFQTEPYYLSDETYAIILENEVHQRTLDKLIKDLPLQLSIVRYPRDMVNIDDIIHFSKISLENGILYFTDEMYHKYLKRVSVNQLVSKMIQKPLELWYLKWDSFDNESMYEIKCRINGLSNKENIRDFLDEELLIQYDVAVYHNLVLDKKNKKQLLMMHPLSIAQLIDENNIGKNQNISICIDYFHPCLVDDIQTLNQHQMDIYLHHRILDQLSASDLFKLQIRGIAIFEGLQREQRQQLIQLMDKFNFLLLANYRFSDYEKCIYRTETLLKEIPS